MNENEEVDKVAELKMEYIRQGHRMQTGVAFKMENLPGNAETTPKHLRVGVNSAMVDVGALTRLLIRKGIITELEHLESIVEMMTAEADRYEAEIQIVMGNGTEIKLG